jgi:hypothetical protein
MRIVKPFWPGQLLITAPDDIDHLDEAVSLRG